MIVTLATKELIPGRLLCESAQVRPFERAQVFACRYTHITLVRLFFDRTDQVFDVAFLPLGDGTPISVLVDPLELIEDAAKAVAKAKRHSFKCLHA